MAYPDLVAAHQMVPGPVQGVVPAVGHVEALVLCTAAAGVAQATGLQARAAGDRRESGGWPTAPHANTRRPRCLTFEKPLLVKRLQHVWLFAQLEQSD